MYYLFIISMDSQIPQIVPYLAHGSLFLKLALIVL